MPSIPDIGPPPWPLRGACPRLWNHGELCRRLTMWFNCPLEAMLKSRHAPTGQQHLDLHDRQPVLDPFGDVVLPGRQQIPSFAVTIRPGRTDAAIADPIRSSDSAAWPSVRTNPADWAAPT